MLTENTKTRILASRYAYEENEMVLVNGNDLCDDIIAHEKLQRDYARLVKSYELLSIKYALKDAECPQYQRINLRG